MVSCGGKKNCGELWRENICGELWREENCGELKAVESSLWQSYHI